MLHDNKTSFVSSIILDLLRFKRPGSDYLPEQRGLLANFDTSRSTLS